MLGWAPGQPGFPGTLTRGSGGQCEEARGAGQDRTEEVGGRWLELVSWEARAGAGSVAKPLRRGRRGGA